MTTTTTEIDALLAKFTDTPEARIRFELVGRDFLRTARAYADDATRPQAEALMKAWAEAPGEGLRKAMASHFMDRARAIVQTGSVTGAGVATPAVPKLGVHPVIARIRAGRRPPVATSAA
jgi:hypothetical protein